MKGSHAKSLWIHPSVAIKPVQWGFSRLFNITTKLHFCKLKTAHARGQATLHRQLVENCSLPQRDNVRDRLDYCVYNNSTA